MKNVIVIPVQTTRFAGGLTTDRLGTDRLVEALKAGTSIVVAASSDCCNPSLDFEEIAEVVDSKTQMFLINSCEMYFDRPKPRGVFIPCYNAGSNSEHRQDLLKCSSPAEVMSVISPYIAEPDKARFEEIFRKYL